MTNLILTRKGEYASSNYTFTGSRNKVIDHLIEEASRMRRESRTLRHMPDNVHSINSDAHPSKLVTMASFALNGMPLESLIDLLNNHGVFNYSVAEAN